MVTYYIHTVSIIDNQSHPIRVYGKTTYSGSAVCSELFRVYSQCKYNLLRVENVRKSISACSNPFECVAIVNVIYSQCY